MSGRPLEELAKEFPSSYLVDMLLAVAAGSAGARMPACASHCCCSAALPLLASLLIPTCCTRNDVHC